MVCYPRLAAATLIGVLVACFEHTAAFAPSALRADSLRTNHRDVKRLHRIQQLSVSSNSVRRLLMRHMTSEAEHNCEGKRVNHDNMDSPGLTRLDFGVGLAATGAAFLLGSGPRHALAEDTASIGSEGGTASAVVEEASPAEVVAAAPEANPDTPALRDLGFEVPYTGKSLPLSKFLGNRATLVVNPKLDDPESLQQVGRWSRGVGLCTVFSLGMQL